MADGSVSAEPPLDEWISLAYDVQSRDPRWIPPSREKLRRTFSGGDPFFLRVPHRRFLVRDPAGRAAARCAAIANPRLKDTDGRPIGQVGFFEARDDARAVAALLDEAGAWLAERGCRRVLAPMNGSTFHSYRFVVSGFDGPPPFLFEPWNPPYYPRLLEGAGFSRCASYFSAEASQRDMAAAYGERRAACEAAGFRIERAPLREGIEEVLRAIYGLSVAIFRGNAFYADLSYEEFRPLYEGIERLLEPALVHFARDREGRLAGFGFGYPDLAAAVRAMGGRSGALARLRFGLARALGGRSGQTIAKTIGVLPEARGASVGQALLHEHARAALALGYERCVHALILAENVSSRKMSEKAGQKFREYALFEKAG